MEKSGVGLHKGEGNKRGVWASLSFISIFITLWLFQEEGGSSQYTNRRQLNVPPISETLRRFSLRETETRVSSSNYRWSVRTHDFKLKDLWDPNNWRMTEFKICFVGNFGIRIFSHSLADPSVSGYVSLQTHCAQLKFQNKNTPPWHSPNHAWLEMPVQIDRSEDLKSLPRNNSKHCLRGK